MADYTQDPGATVSYKDDWTAALAAMATPGLTISSATVTASGGAVVTSATGSGTTVVWTLAVNAVTGTPAVITLTLTATLSNGNVDVRHKTCQVTNT